MKNLYIKLIELRVALKAYNSLDDNTRELRIASTLTIFIEFMENNNTLYDHETLKRTATTIWLSSHPQQLREELLEDLLKILDRLTEENLDQSIYPIFSNVLTIEPMFKDIIFNSELMEEIKHFRVRYDNVKKNLSNNFIEATEAFDKIYSLLKRHIEFTGITLSQIELAASEMGNADYNINLSDHLSLLEGNFSEYRKTVYLIQAFTVVSALNSLITNDKKGVS